MKRVQLAGVGGKQEVDHVCFAHACMEKLASARAHTHTHNVFIQRNMNMRVVYDL